MKEAFLLAMLIGQFDPDTGAEKPFKVQLQQH